MEEFPPPPNEQEFQDISPEQVYDDLEAQRVVKNMVCGRCHGHLNQYPTPKNRMWVILCDNCGIGRGFISQRYADSVVQMNKAAEMEVRHSARRYGYAELVGMSPPRTEAEILQEIGFI